MDTVRLDYPTNTREFDDERGDKPSRQAVAEPEIAACFDEEMTAVAAAFADYKTSLDRTDTGLLRALARCERLYGAARRHPFEFNRLCDLHGISLRGRVEVRMLRLHLGNLSADTLSRYGDNVLFFAEAIRGCPATDKSTDEIIEMAVAQAKAIGGMRDVSKLISSKREAAKPKPPPPSVADLARDHLNGHQPAMILRWSSWKFGEGTFGLAPFRITEAGDIEFFAPLSAAEGFEPATRKALKALRTREPSKEPIEIWHKISPDDVETLAVSPTVERGRKPRKSPRRARATAAVEDAGAGEEVTHRQGNFETRLGRIAAQAAAPIAASDQVAEAIDEDDDQTGVAEDAMRGLYEEIQASPTETRAIPDGSTVLRAHPGNADGDLGTSDHPAADTAWIVDDAKDETPSSNDAPTTKVHEAAIEDRLEALKTPAAPSPADQLDGADTMRCMAPTGNCRYGGCARAGRCLAVPVLKPIERDQKPRSSLPLDRIETQSATFDAADVMADAVIEETKTAIVTAPEKTNNQPLDPETRLLLDDIYATYDGANLNGLSALEERVESADDFDVQMTRAQAGWEAMQKRCHYIKTPPVIYLPPP
jgi:hypothetical protein